MKKNNKLLTTYYSLDYLEATVYDYEDFKSIHVYTKPKDLSKYFDNDPSTSKYMLGGALMGGITGAVVGSVIDNIIDDNKNEKSVSYEVGIEYQLVNGEIIKDLISFGGVEVPKLKSTLDNEIYKCINFIRDIKGKNFSENNIGE